jgi:hypothetical protein
MLLSLRRDLKALTFRLIRIREEKGINGNNGPRMDIIWATPTAICIGSQGKVAISFFSVPP